MMNHAGGWMGGGGSAIPVFRFTAQPDHRRRRHAPQFRHRYWQRLAAPESEVVIWLFHGTTASLTLSLG